MTRKQPKPNPSKSKALAYFEYVLLALCLAMIALRTTVTEGPTTQSSAFAANLGDSLYSLSVSTILIIAFVLWIVWSFCSRNFIYKRTGMEIGLGIFCTGALVAGLAAADKRIAITDITVFLAPAFTALLLVQILDSQSKIKLVLAFIAALGIISAYQCAEQYFLSNQMTIEQYQKDPQSMLGPLGIEAGSFQQFIFEHRLYSKGVRGYFTTRNSAGSFALMALFAGIALFIDKLKNRRLDTQDIRYLLGCGLGIAVILLSLGLTRSKGAIIGLFFAVAAFIVMLLYGNWLKVHKRAILAVCLLLGIVGGGAVVSYGLSHGTLPGGGSMLVRWQYWHASAKMYADHPLTGVGPGNFGDYYTYYKPAAALETVADPHNFPLSILTQYGPLGLLGFMAMLLMPLWRSITSTSSDTFIATNRLQPTFRTQGILFLAAISITLLFIRPILMPETFAEALDVIIYVIVTMHVAPAAVFIIAFVLFAGPLLKTRDAKSEIRNTNTAIVVFCALLGVALHNLIDFAIFEPGVLTTFWAMIACFIAIDYQTKSRQPIVLTPKPFVKILIVTAALVTCWTYFSYVFVPVAKSTTKVRQANVAMMAGQYERAHEFLRKAAADDALSFSALSLNGRLYLDQYEMMLDKDRDLLLRAESCLKTAIGRNSAEFKNFERLTDIYRLLAETSTGQEKAEWLDKAFEAASQAIERYPGCGRLHFKQAQIADQMGNTEIATEQYRRAIEIEDEYRAQFRQIYPERQDVVSRIDKNMYLYAKERVEDLAGKSDN
ncbi:MAG: O-antigen ligase family protein [Sedimentisphaerales bacterium]|nr:O-antigen ligase family protein [Sedimentisphaerales bacterium]